MTRSLAATLASARVKGSTGRDDWQTPECVLERVRQVGPIGLDPCTTKANPVGARRFFTERDDGLETPWDESILHRPYSAPDGEATFVNFPYSQAAAWAAKIVREMSRYGAEAITLCAARPDSRWFFGLVWNTADAVCFWKGRLRFVGAPSSAPFPSAVVYHGPRPWAFESAFHDAGKVVRLAPESRRG